MGQSGQVVTLPADLVQSTGSLPNHCTRHGRSAVKRADFSLPSNSRTSSGGSQSKTGNKHHARVTGWPLCPACVRARAARLIISIVMFYGGVAAFASSFLLGDSPDIFSPVGLIGFAAAVLSAYPFYLSTYARVTSASADGDSVLVANPSAEFTAELPADVGRQDR